MCRFMGRSESLTIDILVVVDEDARPCIRVANGQAGDIGVRKTAPEDVESQLAEVGVDVARHAIGLIAEMFTESIGRFRSLSFEIVPTGNEFERRDRTV
jgi:hypothetical protein